MDLYGENGRGPNIQVRKLQKWINNRTPCENYWRLSQRASKVYRLYALILHLYPTISSTKLTIFPVRHTARQIGRVKRSTIGHAFSRFLSITLVEHGCLVSDKFYRLQHFWYNDIVVITCFARFPRFLFKSRKFVTVRI